jgi:hypothetical protein
MTDKEDFWQAAELGWDAIKSQVQADARKLNETVKSLKGQIEIDKRELIPSPGTLFVDNKTFPAIYLEVSLDIDGKMIKIHQLRRETVDDKGTENDGYLHLDLDSGENIVIKDETDRKLDTSAVSRRILQRFLDR